jgi:hypothetical protein
MTKTRAVALNKSTQKQDTGKDIMKKIKGKLTEPLQKQGPSAKETIERETATNALPAKSREYFHMRDSSLIMTFGKVEIQSHGHTPQLMVNYRDDEAKEIARSQNMELATMFIGPGDNVLVESFFRNHMGKGDEYFKRTGEEVEPFADWVFSLNKGESPFRRSVNQNGIRYLKRIIDRIRCLPDECGDGYENYLMRWFKFWSEKAVEKYGEDACIQFQDFPKEE